MLEFAKEQSLPLVEKMQPWINDIQPFFTKAKQFYEDHTEIVLIVGAASVTYYLTRPPKSSHKKSIRKKEKVGSRFNQTGKSFISDNSDGGFQDEPSTEARRSAESSGREASKPTRYATKTIL